MSNQKTRGEIVIECASAIVACYNHYSDEPIPPQEVKHVVSFLNGFLPQKIDTKEWQAYADQYDAYVAAEEERDNSFVTTKGRMIMSLFPLIITTTCPIEFHLIKTP